MLIMRNLSLISVQSWTYLTLTTFNIVEFLITCNETSKRILSIQKNHWNLHVVEFENDERVIETSLKIIIADFKSELFVQSDHY